MLRVGIINLMPRAEVYERSLLPPLTAAGLPLEPCFVRLDSHAYQSSDREHIERHYQTYERVWAAGPLDGLIVSGAPVEELAYSDVTYWSELCEILEHARTHVPSTLGLCWGGMALAERLGIGKQRLSRKLFGVVPLENLAREHPLLDGAGDPIACPQSRHAGLDEADLAAVEANGHVRVLARSAAAGSTIFESSDGRWVGHLGHPEYEPERLVFEYQRDMTAGRSDVGPPENFDVDAPECTWLAHRRGFFSGWLRLLTQSKP
ncbi:MAG: homoserine O-succinyltransferase [Polyangiales bacterium]